MRAKKRVLFWEDNRADAVVKATTIAEKRRTAKRNVQINMRVSRAERDMLMRLAREGGEAVSAFVREAALDVARCMLESRGEEPEA